ncbi:NAD-P-binding protein [Rhizophagus clarus]|uniref:NAD-P-binding protein n=1 Tax=Rhizophagus clarus TaxID=94130 RepID=A0A8H3LEL6_9GLOM|nr:NAD-P-binding protein [Rhizophagus clarus]
MVKVLVFGATGFIGFSVAQALARSGHETFGLYRKIEKTKELTRNEIFPVLGDTGDVSTWISTAEQVDVIIDTTSPGNEPVKHNKIILDAVFEIGKKRLENNEPKLTFISTTGTWVYGGHPYKIKCESTPLNTNLELVTWRPPIEQTIVESKVINGIIIRPGAVYGKSGSLTALWFEGAIKGELCGVGSKENRWGLVHVDDLADSFVRAVERADIIGGQIFNIINNQSESLGDMLGAVARITEYKGEVKYKSPTSKFEEAMASTGIFSNKKAQSILGWKQRQLGFVDGINIWWNSYKAYIQ